VKGGTFVARLPRQLRGALAGIVACCAMACSAREGPAHAHAYLPPAPLPLEPVASASAEVSAVVAPRYDRVVLDTLQEVGRLRGLPVREKVQSFRVGRDVLLDKTRKKLAEEVPPGVIELQGEGLRALELIPVDYELEEGYLKLITARVAGFYDPDEKSMFLLDDLSIAQEEETLPHELVHALQDQSFSIGPLLDYRPGMSDQLTATQHLIEGDATIAGLEMTYGELDVDTDKLKSAFLLSNAASAVGASTPPILLSTLVSPYTDGSAFVQALKAAGGWPAVDGAFKRLPRSTEQVLHHDKYVSDEAPLAVPELTLAALGAGYAIGLDDNNGELGLKLMLEQWTAARVAAPAAAGWGGDRFVIARRKGASSSAYAVALYTRMDSEADATELAKVLKKQLGSQCRARKELGPISWGQQRANVVIVAGPYERAKTAGATPVSAGDCKTSAAWLKELLAL
jgi:hypothetical protein